LRARAQNQIDHHIGSQAKLSQILAFTQDRFGGQIRSRAASVEYRDQVAHLGKLMHQVSSDKASPTDDQDSHAFRLSSRRTNPLASKRKKALSILDRMPFLDRGMVD
jgi:hypothetical protein